jgi:hypothetical protein
MGIKRRYVEPAGLGAVLHKGRVCVHNSEECAESLVNHCIELTTTLEQLDLYVATKQATGTITVDYWGKTTKAPTLRYTGSSA